MIKIERLMMLGAGLALILSMGCASGPFMAGHPSAVCTLSPLGASTVSGRVTFTQEDGDILVEAEISGLTPGKHGIHVHEHGNCEGNDGVAAGEHFNPTQQPHGKAASGDSHAGDLGNITADASGHARLSLKDPWLKMSGDAGILGRSIVVHAMEDDLNTQPSGNSGACIACGRINAAVR